MSDILKIIKNTNIDFSSKKCNRCANPSCNIVCKICCLAFYCSKKHKKEDDEEHQPFCRQIFEENSVVCKFCKNSIDVRFTPIFDPRSGKMIEEIYKPYQEYDSKIQCHQCKILFSSTSIDPYLVLDIGEEIDHRITMTKRDLDDMLNYVIKLESINECHFCGKKENITRCNKCFTFKSCSEKCIQNNIIHDSICSFIGIFRRNNSNMVQTLLRSGQKPEYALIEHCDDNRPYIICLKNPKYCEFQLHSKLLKLVQRSFYIPIIVIFFNYKTKKISYVLLCNNLF